VLHLFGLKKTLGPTHPQVMGKMAGFFDLTFCTRAAFILKFVGSLWLKGKSGHNRNDALKAL